MSSILERFLCAFILSFLGSPVWASSGITYQGRLLDPNNVPVTSSNVQFKIQIKTPGVEDCLLYEEMQTLDLSMTSGVFAISVGDGSGTRSDAHTSDWNLFETLSNRRDFAFSSGECSAGSSYSPNPTDNRKFRVSFNLGSGWETLPIQVINYIPMSIETYAVGGFPASSLFRVEDAGALGNVAALTTTQYNNLVSLADGTSLAYEKSGSLNGSTLPSIGSGESVRWNGSSWESYSPLASGDEADPTVETFAKTSLPTCASGEVLKSDGSVLSCVTDTSGTISESDIPTLTSAGNGVDGGAISGTIGGSTVINTSGDITTTGNLSVSGSATTGSFSTRQFDLYESTNTHKISFLAPSAFSDYTLTFPVDGGSSGQVLSTNGSGTLSWINAATGSVTSVTGTSPIVVGGTASAPIVSLDDSGVGAATYGSATQVPVIEVDAKGLVQSVTNITISGVSPVGSTLSTGKAWMGDGTGKAGEAYINVSDLKKSDGTNQIPTTCDNSQTLTWSSLTDVFTCSDIGIEVAQISDFPDLEATYFKQGGNSFSAAATLGTADNHDLNFITNNTTKMTVLANGNIGIGTTDASEMLTVSGPDGKIRIQRFDDTYGPDIYLAKSNGTMASPVAVTSDQVAGSLHVQAYNGTNIRNLSSIVTLADDDQIVGSSPGRLEFRTTPVGSNTSVTRMTIKSNGNIGIGTANPTEKLHISATTGSSKLIVETSDATANAHIYLKNPTGRTGDIQFYNNGAQRFRVNHSGPGDYLALGEFTSTWQDRLVLASGGNVGIGTTTPSEKLEVVGNIKGTELCIGADCRSSWPSAGGSGTVTSVASGTGLTGGPITSSGSLSLADTAVTPGSYGSSSSVGSFTVDAQGRLTAASNTAIGSLNASVLTAGTLGTARMPAFTGGDVTSSAGSGVLSIGAGKVTASKLGSDVGLWSVSGSDVYRSSGNVGIGTASPSVVLDVVSPTPMFRISNPGVTIPDYSGVGFIPSLTSNTTMMWSNFGNVSGGYQLSGFTAQGNNSGTPASLVGYHGGTSPTTAAVSLIGWKWDGSTGRSPLASNEIVAQVSNSLSYPLMTVFGSGAIQLKTNRLLNIATFRPEGDARWDSGSNRTRVRILTKIPWVTNNGVSNPILEFTGKDHADYNRAVDFDLSFYQYNNAWYHYSASSRGGIAPVIQLGNVGGYIAITLTKPGRWYFSTLTIDVIDSVNPATMNPNYYMGWTFDDGDLSSATNVVSVNYESDFGEMSVTRAGNVGIGTADPSQKLSVAGTIESTSGGVKFPDGSVQTTAATGGVTRWTEISVQTAPSSIGATGSGVFVPIDHLSPLSLNVDVDEVWMATMTCQFVRVGGGGMYGSGQADFEIGGTVDLINSSASPLAIGTTPALARFYKTFMIQSAGTLTIKGSVFVPNTATVTASDCVLKATKLIGN